MTLEEKAAAYEAANAAALKRLEACGATSAQSRRVVACSEAVFEYEIADAVEETEGTRFYADWWDDAGGVDASLTHAKAAFRRCFFGEGKPYGTIRMSRTVEEHDGRYLVTWAGNYLAQ